MQSFNAAPVRIVIADDHPAIIDGFCSAMRKCKEVLVVGKASNGRQLLQVVEKEQPHIVFTDIEMPEKNGIEAAKEIKKRFPHVKVIAYTGFADDCYITDMMIEAKASGYLLKEEHKNKILEAIETVMKGDVYCSEEISRKLVKLMQRTQTNPIKPFNKPNFTERELLVLIETAKGLTINQIAKKHNLKAGAVESARRRLFAKTKCTNSVELAVYAYRNYFVEF